MRKISKGNMSKEKNVEDKYYIRNILKGKLSQNIMSRVRDDMEYLVQFDFSYYLTSLDLRLVSTVMSNIL